jgi:heme A synthase
MATASQDTAASATADGRARRSFGRLAAFAAAYTYALIVVGGIVRITGSGLGCGDDWPRCHGHWIPPMTFETIIEYSHRLLAAGIVLVVGAVLVRALQARAQRGFPGRGGLVRPALLAAGLLVLQVILGGVTVLLRLPSAVTILHLGTAMALFATLLVAAVRAGALGGGAVLAGEAGGAARVAGMALGGAVLAYLVVLMGALVANTQAPAGGAPSAAALACQGFPLCNGSWLPRGDDGLVHIQLTHRILAYLLFLHVIGSAMVLRRRVAGGPVRAAGLTAVALVVAQVAVGAGMVLMTFPPFMRGLHLLLGAGVWGSLVVWTMLARRAARAEGLPAG